LAISSNPNAPLGNELVFAGVTLQFHEKEWLSSVSIKGENDGDPKVTLYGQLHLLFTCEMETQENEECTKNSTFLQCTSP
jgi:hypothetical protein